MANVLPRAEADWVKVKNRAHPAVDRVTEASRATQTVQIRYSIRTGRAVLVASSSSWQHNAPFEPNAGERVSVGSNVVNVVVRARRHPQSPDIDTPCRLDRLNGRTEVVLRREERIIAGEVNLRQ